MTIAEPPETRPLDTQSREAVVAAVEEAKGRGWTRDDLRTWFKGQGVELEDYLAAKAGRPIAPDVRSTLAAISITALPKSPASLQDPFPELPDAMKAAKRWLLWKAEPNTDPDKKPRKVPYYVTGDRRHGGLDQPQDMEQLETYAAACAVLGLVPGYAGLGFALGPDDTGQHWQGIDLDNLDQHPGLKFVADDLPGYTERSPSGGGVHAVGYGRPFVALGSNSTGIEAYARGRFFTVTGESTGMGDIADLYDFVEGRLAPLHSQRPQNTSAPGETAGSLSGAFAGPDLRSALAAMRSDDRDLWVRMGLALKSLGDQGRGLWLEWSQTSTKYDAEDAGRTWDSFKPDRTGYQAVFAEAQRQGWANPGAGGRPAEADDAPAATREAATDLFEVLSIADLRALPDAEWTVAKVIPKSGLGFIYGPPGSYKTFVCCDLGLSLAYGCTTWLGAEVKHPGSVLYIANEGAAGLKNRITAWQTKTGMAEDTDRFRLIRKSMSFMDAADVDRLQRTVAAEVEARGPVDTVFVDTVSRVLPGADENLQKDMTIFVAACDRLRESFGATVIGVHHTNKQGEMRGSTVFLGQGDFVFRVEKDDGRLSGILTCEKQKEAEDGWKKTFTVSEQSWTPPGRIEASSSLSVAFGGEPTADDEAGPRWPAHEVCKAIIWDLDNAWKRGKPWSPYAQTQKEGRYAIKNISSDHRLPASVVQMMLETWQKGDVLAIEEVSSHSKMKGLRVLQWLD